MVPWWRRSLVSGNPLGGTPAMQIRAVLFDADGVLQKRPAGWRSVLQEIVGPNRDPDRFLADLFSAEDPALCGGCDFAEGLAGVLEQWDCRIALPQMLEPSSLNTGATSEAVQPFLARPTLCKDAVSPGMTAKATFTVAVDPSPNSKRTEPR